MVKAQVRTKELSARPRRWAHVAETTMQKPRLEKSACPSTERQPSPGASTGQTAANLQGGHNQAQALTRPPPPPAHTGPALSPLASPDPS